MVYPLRILRKCKNLQNKNEKPKIKTDYNIVMKTTRKNIKNKHIKKNTMNNRSKSYLLKGGNSSEEQEQEQKFVKNVEEKKNRALKNCGENNSWCEEQIEMRYKKPEKNSCNWYTGEGSCDGYLPPLYQSYQTIFAPIGYGVYYTGHKILGMISSFSIFSLAGAFKIVDKAYKEASEKVSDLKSNINTNVSSIGSNIGSFGSKLPMGLGSKLAMGLGSKLAMGLGSQKPLTGGRKTRRIK